MRANPKPFHMHLLTTAAMLSAAAMPLAVDPQAREKVLNLVEDMTRRMMEGLKAYRVSNAKPDRSDHPVIWQAGSSRLLHAYPERTSKNAAPVLLVPSLINRHEILDLDAQHSFAAFLTHQGFDVYILDWGPPGEDERTFRIDDYITQRLYPVIKQMNKPHVIGYCMGGTMAAGAVAAMGDQASVRSLTLIAAPWDFHAGDKTMALRMQAFALSAAPVMQAKGVLPVDWIQALFASVDPLFAFNKFRAFADMDPESAQARQFVIVEDWLNDGVDLTAPAARQALQEWYVDNQPHNGVWTLGHGLADAGSIKVPTLIVSASHDRLVPGASALALKEHIIASQTLEPELGHIGLMASPRAVQAVWAPVADWLKHCTAP